MNAHGTDATIDAAEIIRALSIIAPGQVVEIRALGATTTSYKKPHTIFGCFDDAAKAAAAVNEITSAKGIYFTPNPVNPALLSRAHNRLKDAEKSETTSDKDITRRRWLLIDADPVRPAGISSTDDEHEAALDRAATIALDLKSRGWPDPIIADSGNGAHLMYRIDLPTDDGGLVARCLAALAAQHGDVLIAIDRTVFNPARIWKLYGTRACKGDNTVTRPHRMARIIDAPAKLEAVTREQLEALAALAPMKETPSMPRPLNGHAPTGDSFAWLDSFLTRNADKLPPMTGPENYQGGRRWTFNPCPWNPEHRNDSAFLIQRADGTIQAGCHHNGCAKENWHTLRAMIEPKAPSANAPRTNGFPHYESVSPPAMTVGGAERGEHRRLVITMASEIKTERIDYLWPGYLARGVLTVSQGLPGFGKTSTASDLIARLTRGDVAPDGSELAGPADVIFLSAEESPSHIIIPRLIAQGADLSRVCIPTIERNGVEDIFWLSGNLDFLNQIADALPALRLLVVDPFTALVRPDFNPNSNEEGRREGTPIVRWAAERNVAVLGLNHLAKGGSGHSVLRGLGAGALNQLARCVWQIGADPNNSDIFVLASVKSSLAKKPKSLCFSIGEGQVVTWAGHSEVTADSMLVEDDGRGGVGKVAAAVAWLEDRLASGEQVPAATIRGDAEGAGLDWWAVKEAKGKLGVEAQKQSFSGQWLWTLLTKGI